MITIEYLNEYENKHKNLTYELNRINRDIKKEETSTTADSVSGSSKEYPYIKKHYKIDGISKPRIKRLRKRKTYIERQKRKIEEELKYKLQILSEEDAVISDIIYQRYIENKDWSSIAMVTNYSGESGPRNLFNRYFNKK